MAFLASVNKLRNSRKTKAQIAERKRPPESEEGAFWLHFICVGSKSLKDSGSFLAFCLLCKLHSSAPPQIISANSGRGGEVGGGLGGDGGMYLEATKWCFMISYLWVIGAAASALALAPDPTPFGMQLLLHLELNPTPNPNLNLNQNLYLHLRVCVIPWANNGNNYSAKCSQPKNRWTPLFTRYKKSGCSIARVYGWKIYG